MTVGNIKWQNLSETKKFERQNKRISSLKREIEDCLKKKDYKNLSLKILCFLREILITATDNYAKKDELNDELYWLRYSFVDKDEDSFLLDEVSTIFFEFQTNPKYKELIKKIDSIKNKMVLSDEYRYW